MKYNKVIGNELNLTEVKHNLAMVALINCQLEFERLCKQSGPYYGSKGLKITSEVFNKIKLMEL